jgi:hypothetical protein
LFSLLRLFEQNEISQWSFVVNIFRAAFSVGALCAQESISPLAPIARANATYAAKDWARENWQSNGNPYSGKSYNTFNAAIKRWEQYWVNNSAGKHVVLRRMERLRDGLPDG